LLKGRFEQPDCGYAGSGVLETAQIKSLIFSGSIVLLLLTAGLQCPLNVFTGAILQDGSQQASLV
jgi:hypothetical protein